MRLLTTKVAIHAVCIVLSKIGVQEPPFSMAKESTTSRPPIVVILGHVDHGKTSLLDTIRKTKVAEKEAGGITQHIGAYQAIANDKLITFLDTPGHEAFTAIRSRGATVADIAVLVVAADEGVKPQTKEAIRIIKETETPFAVAITKTDKEGANPQKIRQELAEAEVLVEDYGGQVPVVELSARKGEGIDQLLEIILLLAEVEELTAPTDGPASGFVLESHLDSRRGTVATVLVQSGQLEIGDWLAAGHAIAKVKSMEDFLGKPMKAALPSQPCVITGWEIVPNIGQKFSAVASHEDAEKLATAAMQLGATPLFVREEPVAGITPRVANIIIKADVQSSLEAMDQVLRTIKSDEVQYHVVDYGVGKIGDADVKNAKAKNAAIIGFHVPVESAAKQSAERLLVRIESRDIIYELVEIVRDIMSNMLDPEIRRTPLGKLKILALFGIQGKSQIVGGKIIQGKAVRGAMVEVTRGGNVISTGKLVQLQQKKADVPEVAEGLECGIRYDGPMDLPTMVIREGDVLEIYSEEKIKRQI